MKEIKHLKEKDISLSTLAEVLENDSAQTEIRSQKREKYLLVTYPDGSLVIKKRTGGLDLHFAVPAKDNIPFESGCFLANKLNTKINFGCAAALVKQEDKKLLLCIVVNWSLLTKDGIITSHLISTVRAMALAQKFLFELDTDDILI